jgi:hypothetical protein
LVVCWVAATALEAGTQRGEQVQIRTEGPTVDYASTNLFLWIEAEMNFVYLLLFRTYGAFKEFVLDRALRHGRPLPAGLPVLSLFLPQSAGTG